MTEKEEIKRLTDWSITHVHVTFPCWGYT